MKTSISKDQIILGIFDCAISILSLWIAVSLKNEQLFIFTTYSLSITLTCLSIWPIGMLVGVYRPLGKHLTRDYVKIISLNFLVYGAIFSAACLLFYPSGIPRSVGIIQPLIAYGLTLLARILYEKFYAALSDKNPVSKELPVAIYGVGETGRMLYRALSKTKFKIIGFVDDEPSLRGRSLFGCKIYCSEDLTLLKEKGVLEVYIAIPSLSGERRRDIFQMITQQGIKVKTVPSLVELALGKANIATLRDLEVDDLLGRSPVEPSHQLMQSDISGKVVLVTGAGGSIGSELCRQILSLHPDNLILLDHNEFGLFTIEQELLRQKELNQLSSNITSLLGNVSNQNMIRNLLKGSSVQSIFHAAAYKHVHLVEENPFEGLKNNILGTLSIVRETISSSSVNSFVLVSTDKAVRPSNVMGLSKRISELIVQCFSNQAKTKNLPKKFCSVRFGNVLGSAGSVVPIFSKQIQNGGPVTVTNKDATRYFMTIPEAASLVIQAGAMADGGDTFLLDMGEPVKIVDLALRMIELSGTVPTFSEPVDGEIQIKFTGLKLGEKLHEELVINSELMPTSHSRISRISEPLVPCDELLEACERLSNASYENESSTLIDDFYSLVSKEASV